MNQKLTLLMRAHMSILAQLRIFMDTEHEADFRRAANWVRTAMLRVRNGTGGEIAALENAATHLNQVAKALGFHPLPLVI